MHKTINLSTTFLKSLTICFIFEVQNMITYYMGEKLDGDAVYCNDYNNKFNNLWG